MDTTAQRGSLCLQEGREFFVTVKGVDYCVKVKPEQMRNEGQDRKSVV